MRSKGAGDQTELLIGRKAETARLAELMELARSGKGQFVAISGEPGIGKTSLTRAAADLAETRGFAVFRVRCHEGQYVAPYWPWAHLLRGVLESVRGSKSAPAFEGYAGSLVTIIPEARQLYPAIHAIPEESPEMARLRLLEAAAGLLGTASAAKPLVLILDNLHCADEPSLRLLEFVTREMAEWRIVIVAAHRPVPAAGSGAFAETIGALAGEALFTSIRLAGWDEATIRGHLSGYMTGDPPQDLVRAVFERTEGNPLFVTEVVQLLRRDGLLEAGAGSHGETWRTHIPEKVRLAILGRVRHLSAHCQETLAAAALMGREFEAALLQEVTRKGEAPLEDSLQEALGEGLIEESGGGAVTYRFTHVLIQEAATELVPAPRRAGLQLVIGEALERRYGANLDEHAGDLAPHFEGAGSRGTEKAVRYRRRAGERALEVFGFEDALEQFERALAIGQEVLPEQLQLDLTFRLAQCQHSVGRFKEAMGNHRRVFEVYLNRGDIERAIDVLIQPHILAEQGMGVLPLFERIVGIVGKDSSLAHRLGSHFGLCLYQETGNFKEAAMLFQLALDDARKRSDRSREMMTLANWARVLHDDLQFEKSRETAELVIQMARDDRDYWLESVPFEKTIALLGLGRVNEATEVTRRLLTMAEMAPSRAFLALALHPSVHVRRLAADFADALKVSDRALSLGQAPFSVWNVADRALLEYEKGDTAEGARYLSSALETAATADMPFHWDGWIAFLIPYISWVSGEKLPLKKAEADAVQVLGSPGLRKGDAANVSVGLGLISVIRRDPAAARKHYAELVPFGGLVVCPYYGLTAEHMLGLLAAAQGDVPLASRHFEAAIAFCRGSGLRLELAYTCRDYAAVLEEGSGPEQRERALACCQEAWEIAQAADLPPLTHRLKELRRRLEQPTVSPRATPLQPASDSASLTPREIEVIRLLAGGLSNEQIGDKLFISVHTVANHVQRILEKTGASNRTDAAMYAVRNGLTPPGQDPA